MEPESGINSTQEVWSLENGQGRAIDITETRKNVQLNVVHEKRHRKGRSSKEHRSATNSRKQLSAEPVLTTFRGSLGPCRLASVSPQISTKIHGVPSFMKESIGISRSVSYAR